MDAVAVPEELVTVDTKGGRVDGKKVKALETWIHACIYRKRHDVGGITRTHPSPRQSSVSSGKPSEVNERLKILSRHQQALIDEKIRLQNRLKKKLLEVCPEILELGDTDSMKILRLLIRYPYFFRYKKLTLEALLKIKMMGKKQASLMLECLRNIQYIKKLSDIYKIIILSYSRRILELKEEIQKLEEIGEKSPEVNRLKTISGVGTKLSTRLMGEIGDINRFENERQLALYCGVACIDEGSGKKKKTKAVYKANKICKATMIEKD